MSDGLRPFVPAEESPESWRRYCAFERAMRLERRPGDTPEPAELIEAGLKREEPHTIRTIHVVEREGAVVGALELYLSRPGAPGYSTNRHLIDTGGGVLPEFRRQGIARSLLPLLTAAMDEAGATVASMYAELDSGHSFLRSIGASAKLTGHENRLRLADVDWELMEEWRRIETGFRLDLYEPRIPEALFETYCPAYTLLAKDIPYEELEHGEWIVTPQTQRDNYARMDVEGTSHHCLIAYDADGMVGVTEYLQRPYQPEHLIQELTAVHARARGRGLGKLLKGRLLIHVRQIYPQARFVVTDNASSNAPMLSINERMGFKPYVAGSGYQVTRGELGAVL